MKLPVARPQLAICLKCKHCIKSYPFFPKESTKVSCRAPGDPIKTDYVSGRITKTEYSCHARNERGSCKHYEKLWYRRPTYVKPLFGIFLLVLLAVSVGCAPKQYEVRVNTPCSTDVMVVSK